MRPSISIPCFHIEEKKWMMSVLRLHGCALIHHCSECTRTEMLPFLHCCLLIFKLREPRRALQLSSSARFLVGPCLDQRGCLSAHGGEDAFCFSAYLTWGQQRWTSRKERGWGESPSSAAFAVGLMSEGFTQLWGLLFGKTDCFSRDNGCAGAGAGSSGRQAHGRWMGPAAVQMEGSASKTKVKLLPAHCWKERGRTMCSGWELPVWVPWSQGGFAGMLVPWEEELPSFQNESRPGCWPPASQVSNPSRGWHCPHTCPATSVGFALDSRVQGNLLFPSLKQILCLCGHAVASKEFVILFPEAKIVFVTHKFTGLVEEGIFAGRMFGFSLLQVRVTGTRSQALSAPGHQISACCWQIPQVWGRVRGAGARQDPGTLPAWGSQVPNTMEGCLGVWPA